MLTVMITCFNQGDIISKTIDSLLNQKTNVDFKILISDDLSKDNSMNILKEYESKYSNIKVVQPKEKFYVGHNRNTLFQNVDTEYCLFVDGDDAQKEDYLDPILQEIKLSKKDVYRIKNFEETWSDRKILKKSLNYSNFMLFVYKTEYIKDVFVNPNLRIGEDVEFEFRNYKLLHKEINVINTCYALNRRDDNESLTKNGDLKARYELELKLYSIIKNYEDIDPYVKSMVNRKKVELINFATLIDEKPLEFNVKIKNIGNRYLACFVMYKILPRNLFKYVLLKKIGKKF
ncbi:MAG: glycosyltransferase family 2 protein [Mycoplasmatales bacterium]